MTNKNFSIENTLSGLTTKKRYYVAFSGGVDSHVLLHLLKNSHVRAIHINHGLSKNAHLWQKHCRSVCKDLGIPFESYSVNVEKKPGLSLEAQARELRYQCLIEHLQKNECLLTAHNADDQAETVLLQLLRGTGVAGLSAMPKKKMFNGSEHLRPLLSLSRVEILAYAKKNKLQWIEDESNLDIGFDRNYMRHKIMPIITSRWPEALTTLGRAAHNCAEAKALLFDVACDDLQTKDYETLDSNRLKTLPILRQHNLLRYWIHCRDYLLPSKTQLSEIFRSVINAKKDADPCFEWSGQTIRRYRDKLYLLKKTIFNNKIKLNWNLMTPLILPNHLGELKVTKTEGEGLSAELMGQPCQIRFRQGGEKIKPSGRNETHTLKNLFYEWEIPPWEREKVPLLFYQHKLIAVVGYCIAEHFQVEENAQLIIRHAIPITNEF